MKLFSRLFADVTIRVSGGKAKLLKGKLNPKVMREISLLCSDLSLNQGEIWIDKIGKVTFSGDIDEQHHQRFRNVMFS
jgi:hypothetical protein